VLVWARDEKPFTWDGETKDVISADVVVLDPPGSGPIEYKSVFIFPKVMQGQIRGNLGRNRPNLGRVGKGEAKPRQTAPWILMEANEQDKKMARAYMANPNATPVESAPVASASTGAGWTSGEPPF
jgi:hypothetical protein